MSFKTCVIVISLMAAVLLAQAQLIAPKEGNGPIKQNPDVLFIENPDTFPKILSPANLPPEGGPNNLVCTAAMCRSVCNALGYIFGRCNFNNVCVCSNF